MARYLLHHRHEPEECGVVSAAFKGHHSPLRHRPTLASCRTGGHLVAKVKELIHEGNVRRIIIKDADGKTAIEIPVTVHRA